MFEKSGKNKITIGGQDYICTVGHDPEFGTYWGQALNIRTGDLAVAFTNRHEEPSAAWAELLGLLEQGRDRP